VPRGAIGPSQQPVFVVAAGKAAWPMATALAGVLAERAGAERAGGALPGGKSSKFIVAGPRAGTEELPDGFEWFNSAHPFPDSLSEAAGRRALAIAADSHAEGSLVVLLSGGASSMLAVPGAGLTLADKAATSRALMNAGVAIDGLNCVRKHLSSIKGGRLAAAARRTITLAISDVHGPVTDDPSVIGSGPTVADPSTCADALAIVHRAGVARLLPAAVMAHLERCDETPKPGDLRLTEASYEVIGNRQMAMDGAARVARARGYAVRIAGEATSGEAQVAGAAFASEGMRHAAGFDRSSAVPICVIQSGETTVHVRGTGRGGRNQEFALGAIPVLESCGPPGAVVVLASAGTDGIDGPTDAAGAVVDTTSSARARRAGLERDAALACNGSYDFFAPLDDLIVWGPTGTNVGDLHVMLIA
jgi:glycerate-2-kinase